MSIRIQVEGAGPAPLAAEALRGVLAAAGESTSLPAEAYTSEAVLAWERERFFEAGWVCAGRAADLAQPGDQAAVAAGGETVLLVRGDDGALRGFFDVCRHRGHQLLERGARAARPAIVCPYHAWSYRLDGRLRAAPRFGDLPGDHPAREGLVPVRVALWNGFVFADVGGAAPDLAAWFGTGGMDELLAPYGLAELAVGASHDYEVAANWKLVVENYHECYHCPSIHPELCRVTPPNSGDNFATTGPWVGGSMTLRPHADTMSLDGRSGGPPLPGLREEQRRQVLYLGLFPNLLLSLHPDYVMTHRIEPLAPGRSRIECQWLFPAATVAADGFDPAWAVDFWDLTNRQDWHACESVQRGATSRGYRQGPLGRGEGAVRDFLTTVARAYLGLG
jgi:Rieske 2Fe-2S family protein